MSIQLLRFPWVRCEEHGKQLAVSVCKHVQDRTAQPVFIDPPTSEVIGVMWCQDCTDNGIRKETTDDGVRFGIDLSRFTFMCEMHALEILGEWAKKVSIEKYTKHSVN